MTSLERMRHGTRLFLDTVAEIDDEHLDRPSALAGWTGRHLVAHVHFNALALRRLAGWAATGTENRMYASAQQRADEIEDGSARPAGELRTLVQQSADALDADLAALSSGQWAADVVTAQGRTVAATEIPWMRTREVYVHAVDLNAGVTFADLPEDVCAALAVDVVRKRAGGGEAPGLAAWLTGRAAAPTLGPWL